MIKLKIYTDGGCLPNPGFGAYGFVIVSSGEIIFESWGHNVEATSNIMELTAIIEAIKHVYNKDYDYKFEGLIIYSDSKYCINGINDWIKKWKLRNWMTNKNEPVKNKYHWIELDELRVNRRILFEWVKGHNGDIFNERADELCNLELVKYFGKEYFDMTIREICDRYEKIKSALIQK